MKLILERKITPMTNVKTLKKHIRRRVLTCAFTEGGYHVSVMMASMVTRPRYKGREELIHETIDDLVEEGKIVRDGVRIKKA